MKGLNNQKILQNSIQINREDLQMLKCSNPNCNSTMFMQFFELGILPALMSPNEQKQLVQLPKMICIECGSSPSNLKE